MSHKFKIGDTEIDKDSPPYVIAEAGINHNGNLNLALDMVEVAKKAGANAIKFQTFKASEFCGDKSQLFTYQSQGKTITEPMFELFNRLEFTEEQWQVIKYRSEEIGIEFLSTPQNISDLELLLSIGIKAIKIGSDDLTNIPLIKSYSSYNLPIILSTGMSNLGEIHNAVDAAGWFNGKEVSVLICTSLYPTPDKEASVSRVKTLINALPGLVVGFSDHTIGNTASIMSLALGARIFEKHFTLDKNFEGPDHWFSNTPEELVSWVNSLRVASESLGEPHLIPSKLEVDNRNEFRRVIVAVSNIQKGELLSESNIGMRRVGGGRGLQPMLFEQLIGKMAQRNYALGDVIEL
jgi:N-acetylneuraminate synthase/N,N'-diacetyllegionaminate synthase